jgi:hypothetical protein
MKRLNLWIKLSYLAMLQGGRIGRWAQPGQKKANESSQLSGELFIQPNSKAGLILALLFPWRGSPDKVIVHRRVLLWKNKKRLDELLEKIEKSKRTRD